MSDDGPDLPIIKFMGRIVSAVTETPAKSHRHGAEMLVVLAFVLIAAAVLTPPLSKATSLATPSMATNAAAPATPPAPAKSEVQSKGADVAYAMFVENDWTLLSRVCLPSSGDGCLARQGRGTNLDGLVEWVGARMEAVKATGCVPAVEVVGSASQWDEEERSFDNLGLAKWRRDLVCEFLKSKHIKCDAGDGKELVRGRERKFRRAEIIIRTNCQKSQS
jgi:hypothetical protein